MTIIIGTLFAGKIKTQKNQYISTKMFFLGIPIFPVSSMLVTSKEFDGRRGIEIPKNINSIIATYLRIFSIPFLLFIVLFSMEYYPISERYILLLLSSVFCLAIWFLFGKTTKTEYFVRDQFGKVFNIYVMPEWLYYEDLEAFHNIAKNKYESEYGQNWETVLKNLKPSDKNFALVFCYGNLDVELFDKDEKRKYLESKITEHKNAT